MLSVWWLVKPRYKPPAGLRRFRGFLLAVQMTTEKKPLKFRGGEVPLIKFLEMFDLKMCQYEDDFNN